MIGQGEMTKGQSTKDWVENTFQTCKEGIKLEGVGKDDLNKEKKIGNAENIGTNDECGTKEIDEKTEESIIHENFQGDNADSTTKCLQLENIDKATDDLNEDQLDLVEKFGNEIQNNKDIKDDEGLEYNIMHVNKAGDISPRHTNHLKAKNGRSTTPLQVK